MRVEDVEDASEDASGGKVKVANVGMRVDVSVQSGEDMIVWRG